MSIGDLAEAARDVEALGIAGIALADHACVPSAIESIYPAAGTAFTLPLHTEFPDPLISAAIVGAATTKVRVMTSVLLVPLRHPILLAREVACAFNAAGGRLDLGVGVGWMREEFDALGVPFDDRGQRMDEALGILRRLWTEPAVEHHGDFYSFDSLSLNPKPRGRVPMIMGGHSAAAFRRAARADGWVGGTPTMGELDDALRRLQTARDAAGTADAPFTIRTGLKGRVTGQKVDQLRRRGVNALIVSPWQVVRDTTSIFEVPAEAFLEGLSALAREHL